MTFACALSKHGHLKYCKRERGRLASENLQVLALFHLYTLNLPFCCAVSSAWIVLVVHMHTCRSKTSIISWLTATERAFKQILGKSYSLKAHPFPLKQMCEKPEPPPKNRLRTLLACARAPPRCRPLISTMRGRMAMGRR